MSNTQRCKDDEVATLIANADAHFSVRRIAQATAAYQQVLALRPHNAHALHRMGLICVHTDNPARARDYLEQAVLAAPERAELWEHAGLLAALLGDHEPAEARYRQALGLAGPTASLHRNLADCLQQCGRLGEAIGHYEKSLEIEPGLHHAVRALARIHTGLGHPDDAADYWQHAWALDSASLQDGLDLIGALAKAGRTQALAEVIRQISARYANDASALKALAVALNTNDCFNAALRVARQGLALDPQHPLLHHNAARALSISGKTTESRPHSMEAARLLPDNAHLQFHLACVQLALGEFEAGWRRYAWFYALPGGSTKRIPPMFRAWQGEPVAACRFLLVGEQGLGDQIQCLRFAEWLHRQQATVDVLIDAPLAELAAGMASVHAVFTTLPPGPYDYACHMLRMPEYMKLKLSMLPVAMPYLTAPSEKTAQWRARINTLSSAKKHAGDKRVGIVWAGSPSHPLDRFRSIRLDTLRPLFTHSGISWYSLQKGDRERESEHLAGTYGLHTLGSAIGTFTDTLAILQTLDLLITVDTSIAHLAGAAGLPVWVLTPAYSEWRWLNGRTDSPWYPSMRLFRQRELNHWDPVIEEVQAALQLTFAA
jgi:tetratricopeptide (TPR) repeat protein/ADP-heptose:LPS heptosyltransferase